MAADTATLANQSSHELRTYRGEDGSRSCIAQAKSKKTRITHCINLHSRCETRQDNPFFRCEHKRESRTREPHKNQRTRSGVDERDRVEIHQTRPSRESSNETESRFIERDETRFNKQDRLGNNSRYSMSTRAPLKGASVVNTILEQPVCLEVKN